MQQKLCVQFMYENYHYVHIFLTLLVLEWLSQQTLTYITQHNLFCCLKFR